MRRTLDTSHNLKAYDKDMIILFSARVKNMRQACLFIMEKTQYLTTIDKIIYKNKPMTMADVLKNFTPTVNYQDKD